jgi:hypothetical protein
MPRGLFRIVACLLLALAVPIQGMAAVSAGVCMAFGGHQDHHADVSGSHHHQHDQAPLGEHDSLGGHHCAPCVSCCAAAAIASTPAIVFSEARPDAAIAAPQHWLAGVPPDELDRPPLAL